jgi:hypothetical protein
MPQPKKAAPAAKPAGKRIERESQRAWWCPVCDHSNAQLVGSCAGCGAVRDGDKVKVP